MKINKLVTCVALVLMLSVLPATAQTFSVSTNSKPGFSNFSSIDFQFRGMNSDQAVSPSRITNNVLQLTSEKNFLMYRGAAIYPDPVSAHLGFKLVFGWNTSYSHDCINSDRITYNTWSEFESIQMFLSPVVPDNDLGRPQLFDYNNVFMVGYAIDYSEFYVCDWDAHPPIVSDGTRFLYRKYCKVFPYLGRRLASDYYHEFTIQYSPLDDLLQVAVNGSNIFQYTMPRKLNVNPRYLGLSAFTVNYNALYDVRLWSWDSRGVVTEFYQASSHISTIGSAFAGTFKRLYLTSADYEAGLGVLTHKAIMLNRFFSMSFKWTVTGQSAPGEDGFALFFAKASSYVLSDNLAIGPGLGVQSLLNHSIIGYNRVLNEFYVCRWNTPLSLEYRLRDSCPTYANVIPAVELGTTVAFDISYYNNTFRMYVNGRFAFVASLEVDQINEQVVGFTGSSYQASVTQYISDWTFQTSFDKLTNEEWSYMWSANNTVRQSLLLLGTASISPGERIVLNRPRSQLSPSLQSSVGGILQLTSFAASKGFESHYSYEHVLSNTFWDTVCGASDIENGVTMFLTSDPAVKSLRDMPDSDLGLTKLKNVLTITTAYSNTVNYTMKVIVCRWGQYNVANPGDFRNAPEYCTMNTAYGRSSPYIQEQCPLNQWNTSIAVIYSNTGVLTVEVNGNLISTIQDRTALDPSLIYFAGIISADHITVGTKKLNYWILRSHNSVSPIATFSLANNAQNMATLGVSSISSNRIITSNEGVGAAMYKTPMPVRLGFNTTFTWKPSTATCYYGGGFTFFITKSNPANTIIGSSNNTDTGFGLDAMTSSLVASVSYVGAANTFTSYFNNWSPSVIRAGNPLIDLCGNFSEVTIEYTLTNVVRLYIHGFLAVQFRDPLKTILDPTAYYIGLAMTEGRIERWSYSSYQPIFTYGNDNSLLSSITTMGTASVVGNSLRLTTGGSQSGLGFYNQQIWAHYGFKSRFVWTLSNCDAYGGSDGVTLFLSRDYPLTADVLASSGGLLGIGNVPNITMFAYSATYNEFYLCNWTTPLGANYRYACTTVGKLGSKMDCGPSNNRYYDFNFQLSNDVFTLTTSGALRMQVPLKLDPVPYYFGVSGGTGGGYFQQDVTEWTLEGTVL